MRPPRLKHSLRSASDEDVFKVLAEPVEQARRPTTTPRGRSLPRSVLERRGHRPATESRRTIRGSPIDRRIARSPITSATASLLIVDQKHFISVSVIFICV
jgi:hypothetical protein